MYRPMTILNRIMQDLRTAMRAGEGERTTTLRMMVASLHNEKIAKRTDLTEEEMVVVLHREVKRRREAAETYAKGGRSDLADKELAEADLISAYLPKQLTDEEIHRAVDEAVAGMGVSPAFGAVMKAVMEKVKGKADGKAVSDAVKRKLQEAPS